MEEEPKAPTDKEIATAERISARRQIASSMFIVVFAGFLSVLVNVIDEGISLRASFFGEVALTIGAGVIGALAVAVMTRRAIRRPATKIAHVEAQVQAVFSNALDSVKRTEGRERV